MRLVLRIALGLALSAGVADAQLSIRIGDNDGFGLGIADNAVGVVWPGPGASGEGYDGRALAEAFALNGAQLTDVYSALRPCCGPHPFATGSVFFPVLDDIISGVFTVDMGDFQATQYGQFSVGFNGVLQPNLFDFQDGFRNTLIRGFVLDAATIASINAANGLTVTIGSGASLDYVAFDYFQLDARITAAPEPSTVALLASGLAACLVAVRRRRAA